MDKNSRNPSTTTDVAADILEQGIAHADEGDFDQAIADFSKVIQLDPNDAEAYAFRSNVYHLRAETQTRGSGSLLYASTIGVLRRKKDDDMAIADMKMAAKLAPENDKYHSELKAILAEIGYGYGITISGRTLNPGAEIKKRLIAIPVIMVAALIIGFIRVSGRMIGDWTPFHSSQVITYAFFGLIYGIGIIPWLVSAKRNILNIPGYFKYVLGTEKSLIFAVIITLLWKPFLLFFLLVYASPFIGIFQMVQLLVERARNKKK